MSSQPANSSDFFQTSLPQESVSLLLVIAGPAGSGKTTLCERLVAENDRVERVVTCTTRRPREGEKDGVDYHFLGNARFDQAIEEGAFLEWAKVHTNRYGVLRSGIREKLSEHVDMVMNVDVQGVANIRRAASEDPVLSRSLVTVFILPSDMDVLRRRLRERGKDDEAEIERRIETAKREVPLWREFDYVIVTKSKEEDFAALQGIHRSEKLRASRLA